MISFLQQLKNRLRIDTTTGWSIGVYTGSDPLSLTEYGKNPVMSSKSIKTISAAFIADPFIVKENETYYMFFELMNAITRKAEIGLATSEDCYQWHFDDTVLQTDFHLSYPQVFKSNGNYYMIPSCSKTKNIKLYVAKKFPYEWSFVINLISGASMPDPTVFYHEGYWYLWTTNEQKEMLLYYSQKLISRKWILHPSSPVTKGRYTRQAGRIIRYNDRILRFSQDAFPVYGKRIICFEIIRLTPIAYEEKLIKEPYLLPGKNKWNADRMHHVDLIKNSDHSWIAFVDGYSEDFLFRGLWSFFKRTLLLLTKKTKNACFNNFRSIKQ